MSLKEQLFSLFLLSISIPLASQARNMGNNGNDIVIENTQFRLVVGNNAMAKSLVVKATGEECLFPGEKIALFSVTQERPYHNEIKLGHPNRKTTFQADTVYRKGDQLIVGFELLPYHAVIDIRETPSYIGFSLSGFITDNAYPTYMKMTPPPATEITLLQLPVRNRKYFGEWLNVCWDEKSAVNLLATDAYAYIDFEKRKDYRILKASALKEIKFKGVGAALIACASDKLLDNIAQIEEDFNLPKGVESRRGEMIHASYYWISDLSPDNLEKHLKYAKMGGFRLMNLYYPCFESSGGYGFIGNYEIDRKRYPNGKEDLQNMLTRIKANGIIPGVHFLHSHIGRKSKYVTPVPDHRLNIVKTFHLSEELGENDTIVSVEENPEGAVMADGCRVLKVGTELIAYQDYSTEPPYRFTGCTRGIDHTTVNSLPKGSAIGILDVSEFGAASVYIDQRTTLQDEVAVKIANLYDAGFQFFYFDGSEGVNPPFAINVPLAQYRVFRLLQPAPLFTEGAAKAHFSWHMLSGGNAFDVFPPERLKEETRKWPAEEAPRMRQDFTRINFGWLGYRVPDKSTIGTQPDMLEYVTGVAAAWDCPISIQSNLQAFDRHPRTADNLEVLRRWEEVRAKHWLTETQKKALQNVHQEHHLLINEQGAFELVPYRQIDGAAKGNKEIRAFVFRRNGATYLLYWHISGEKKLKLPIDKGEITLCKNPGEEETAVSANAGYVTLPVGERRYLKTDRFSEAQVTQIVQNGEIVE